MPELLSILALTVIAATVWFAAQPVAVFVVRVRAGNAVATSGTVTPAFLAAVAEVCEEFGIQSGVIRGVARGRRISLKFSSSFPPSARQRLRNWWAQSGWAAPQPKPPRR